MITMAGASRMSSVRGLNASPHSAIVFPARPFSPLKWATILSTSRPFCRSFTASTARRILKSYPRSSADFRIAFTSFGKQLPPYPTPGNRNDLPMRPSAPIARRT